MKATWKTWALRAGAIIVVVSVGLYLYAKVTPRIWEVPSPVPAGAMVLIWGDGFSASSNTVTIGTTSLSGLSSKPAVFGGKESPSYEKGYVISFVVPSLPNGTYILFVTTPYGKSNVEQMEIATISPPPTPPSSPSTPSASPVH